MLHVSPEEITEGRLTPALLLLAAPLVAQNLVRVVGVTVDFFWLGRYSESAVAGVGLAAPAVAFAAGVILFMPFVATQVVVSRRVGSGDTAAARRGYFNGLLLAAVVAVVAGAVVYVVTEPVVGALISVQPGAGAGAVKAAAVTYIQVSAIGFLAMALGDTAEAGFIAWGDSKTSLAMNVLAVSVNVVLDPLLIFGYAPLGIPEYGVAGAAAASVVAEGTAFLLAVGVILTGRNGWMLARGHLAVSWSDLRGLVAVGLPVAGQQAARQSVRLVMVSVAFVAGGAAGLAAYFLGARVAGIAFVPAGSMQQAVQSVVGQNLGAEHPERAERAVFAGGAVTLVGLSTVGVIQWFVPEPIVGLLAPELSAEAVRLSVLYLQILALGYPAMAVSYLVEGGFNGAGQTTVSFYATLGQFWGVRLPVALVAVFALSMGAPGVFWAVTISNLVAAVAIGAYYWQSVADGLFSRAAQQAAAD
ncbi:MATE family efflux transporter [Natronomonas sp. EA1]|uniref:MATE family efflux transporter n=1 Tax=Natronomonas sp. EA1 TaxID=3421655 RepID=UPI003EB937D1